MSTETHSRARALPPAPRISTTYEQFMAGTTAYSIIGEDYSQTSQLTALEKFAAGKSEAVLNTLAGGTAGAVSGLVTCPLDVIKTKLQAQGGFRALKNQTPAPVTLPGIPLNSPANVVYNGMVGTAKVIWREEGLRGMYRGLGPIILGYLPTWATWFLVYGKAKAAFKPRVENEDLVNFMSSIIAGGSSTMVTNPIWVIKTRMMSQVSRRSKANVVRPPWHYTSTLDAVRKMYQTEGILSFYSGLSPALLGLTHVAVQFPLYEYLRRRFTGGQALGEHGTGVSEGSQFIAITSASFFSKLIASAATYPHEVIRTRLQTQQRSIPAPLTNPASGEVRTVTKPRYKGIVMTFRTILAEEGWRAFYSGMGTNMTRAIPAAMTTMLTYEYVIKQLHTARTDGQKKLADGW